MNLSTAIFLVEKTVRAVRVVYDPENAKQNNPNKLFKTLDQTLALGDFVVVPTQTRHGYTVCKVGEIDFAVNYDTHLEYEWIVGKVDIPAYQDVVAQEQKMLDKISKAEENRKRKELIDAMQLSQVDFSGIDILNGQARIPAPATPRGQMPSDGDRQQTQP